MTIKTLEEDIHLLFLLEYLQDIYCLDERLKIKSKDHLRYLTSGDFFVSLLYWSKDIELISNDEWSHRNQIESLEEEVLELKNEIKCKESLIVALLPYKDAYNKFLGAC